MLPLFAITIFLGAALLFLVQPIAAKLILPLLGGSPAVWNSCMLFFQAALLGGYCLAHILGKLRPRLQTTLYALALALPIVGSIAFHRLILATPTTTPPPVSSSPIPWLLAALSFMVGAPFLFVSAAGPLLQRWFSATSHSSAKDPYFLYAASNAGSMLGLLGYPFLVEPWLTLTEQRRAWSIAFGLFAILVACCAVALKRNPTPEPSITSNQSAPVQSLTWKQRALWLLLAFIPSSLTLGVTQHISTDIAAVPLLWVLPLSIYLLTFIIAFSKHTIPALFISRVLPILVLCLAVIALLNSREPIAVITAFHLLGLFACALLCHTRLATSRPDPSHLTEFYLLIAVGGVLGGIFNAILAPLLFSSLVEYPVVLVLALLCRTRPASAQPDRALMTLLLSSAAPLAVAAFLLSFPRLGPNLGLTSAGTLQALWIAIPAVLCLTVYRFTIPFALALAAMFAVAIHYANVASANLELTRTFFGILRLSRDGDYVTLIHNTTTHGLQNRSEAKRRIPLGYYHNSGPIGQVFETFGATPLFDRVGLVGLGSGALAAYGRPGQEMTFHEIDPAIVRIAENPNYFTYLSDSRATHRIILGDGRLTLAQVPDAHYGLIVLDAFSSDSIPIHLITREAIALYLTKLAPHGLLAFHISNHFLDLAPVLSRNADALGLAMLWRKDEFDAKTEKVMDDQGIYSSNWVLLARDPADFGTLPNDKKWLRAKSTPDAPLWTDDYSNILSVFQWQ